MGTLTPTLWAVIIGVGVIYIATTLACILNIFKRFTNDMDRMIWTQVSIIPFFGALAYLLFGRKQGIRKE
ncbi:MAG: PLDc N-terminal domain-containing protein [Proteobacteria bacterium]|nr:PLDc N-terminal domain-containing protein [Pseudomonadota bacterium]MBU1610283.1 PLDc N-terminal domain-containing protein [Pseudomonadota bacterium]